MFIVEADCIGLTRLLRGNSCHAEGPDTNIVQAPCRGYSCLCNTQLMPLWCQEHYQHPVQQQHSLVAGEGDKVQHSGCTL